MKHPALVALFAMTLLFSLPACTQSDTSVMPGDIPAETNTIVHTVTPSSVDASCGSDTEMTFKDWLDWTKVNESPIKGHDAEWTDVYVDELAEDIYLTASSPYPLCARIVKAEYTDPEATNVSKLAIMVKMSPGYDPDHADWWYGVYDQTGTIPTMQGKVAFCIDCHKDASSTDYLFSNEVLEASKE